MANDDKKEPQSYGSEREWVTGRTGQQVNPQKQAPPPEHADFYDDRRESEGNATHQGGLVTAEQASETPHAPATTGTNAEGDLESHKGVSNRESGYFRKRDYE